MLRFKRWIYRIFVVRINLYGWKSKLAQWLWERNNIGSVVRWNGLEPEAVQAVLNCLKWHPDGWREGWDAFHHPDTMNHLLYLVMSANGRGGRDLLRLAKTNEGVFYKTLKTIDPGLGQPNQSSDCDDFAAWALSMLDARYRHNSEPRAWVLNVVWDEQGWPYCAGHNVCLYRDKLGKYKYIGVGQDKPIGPFDTIRDVANSISDDYGPLGDTIGFRLYDLEEITIN